MNLTIPDATITQIVETFEQMTGGALRKAAPMPESLGDVVDDYRVVRETRLLLQHACEQIEEREKEMREYLIVSIPKSKLGGVAGQKYRATIVRKEVTRIGELDAEGGGGWAALTSWIRKHDRFDLLQHRLSDKAVQEWRKANNAEIPGTDTGFVVDVSIEKV